LVKLEPHLGKSSPFLNSEQKELCNELLFNASKIYDKKYHNLAKKLIEFAEKNHKKTKPRALNLKKEIIKKSKKPLFIYMEEQERFWKSLRLFSKKLQKTIKKERKEEEGRHKKMS